MTQARVEVADQIQRRPPDPGGAERRGQHPRRCRGGRRRRGVAGTEAVDGSAAPAPASSTESLSPREQRRRGRDRIVGRRGGCQPGKPAVGQHDVARDQDEIGPGVLGGDGVEEVRDRTRPETICDPGALIGRQLGGAARRRSGPRSARRRSPAGRRGAHPRSPRRLQARRRRRRACRCDEAASGARQRRPSVRGCYPVDPRRPTAAVTRA